jgi:hypothetical protein
MTSRFVIFYIAWLLLCCGCQSSSGTGATVSGNVTLDGQPISTGAIQIIPSTGQGQPVGGEIINGAYALKDAPLGKVLIIINATKETGKMYDDNGTMRKEVQDIIPPAAKAGFEKEIKVGENKHDIVITSK